MISKNEGNVTKRFIVVKKTYVDKDGVILGENKKALMGRKSPDFGLRRMESDAKLKELQRNIKMLKIGTSPFIDKHFQDDDYRAKGADEMNSDDEL